MTRNPMLCAGIISTALGLSSGAIAQQDVFRSISKDGTVEFSDTGDESVSESFRIRKPVVVTRLSETRDEGEYTLDPETPPETPPTSISSYRDLVILSPGSTGNSWYVGDVPVNLAVEPQLQTGHEFVIEINGDVVSTGSNLNHAIKEVYRGQHTLRVSIRDKSSGTTLNSTTVDFQVHRRIDRSSNRMLNPDPQKNTADNPSDINVILGN